MNKQLIYTNKHTKKELRGSLTFTVESKTREYFEINLIKKVKDIYSKNVESLLHES